MAPLSTPCLICFACMPAQRANIHGAFLEYNRFRKRQNPYPINVNFRHIGVAYTVTFKPLPCSKTTRPLYNTVIETNDLERL